MLNAHYLNRRAFIDANRFQPERFLSKGGRFVKPSAFVMFGRTARACPGEDIATRVLVLFLAALVQRFRVEAAAELPAQDDLKPGSGGVHCRNFTVRLLPHADN